VRPNQLTRDDGLALDCTLVTDDAAFGRVPGLTVENWLRETG